MKFRLLVALGEWILKEELPEDRPRGKFPFLRRFFPTSLL